MARKKQVQTVLDVVRYSGFSESVLLDEVRPLAGNARVHSEEQIELLADSIRRFGVYRPLVVHRSTRQILAGNGLYEAARRVGLKELPVVWFDGSESDALALSLTDNRAGELSDWDYSLLAVMVSRTGEVLDKAVLDAEFRSALESLASDWAVEAESYIAGAASVEDAPSLGVGETDMGADVSAQESPVLSASPVSASVPAETRHAAVYIVKLDADGLAVLSRWGALWGMAVNGDLVAELVRRSAAWYEEEIVDGDDDS